jgi:hypothetical protein
MLHGSMHIGNTTARLQDATLPAWRERKQVTGD